MIPASVERNAAIDRECVLCLHVASSPGRAGEAGELTKRARRCV